jgi:hypothetical protein
MKPPRIDPSLRELIALALLAGGGCGLALALYDFLFAAIFAAMCGMIAIAAIRRLR